MIHRHKYLSLGIIATALLLLGAACGQSTTTNTTPTNTTVTNSDVNLPGTGTFTTNSSTSTSVSIADFSYSPKSLTVAQGTTVTWTNNGQSTHTVDIDGEQPSGDIAAGKSYSHTFNTAGTFTYRCSHHATMVGTVTVTK